MLRGPQLSKAGVDILCSAQFLKDWDQVQQLSVCHVIKPRLHGHLGQGEGGVSLLTANSALPCPKATRAGWARPWWCTPLLKPRLHCRCPPPPCSVGARNTHGILWVEDVRGGRVVQNEGFPQVPSQAAEVLDIAALMEHAGLTEEAGPEHPTPVQQISHRVGILERRRWLCLDAVLAPLGCPVGQQGAAGPPL